MDEMLAVFARHDNASDYDGNPVDEFLASIKYEKYWPDEMSKTIGF
jgi:hypothetical protein